MNNNMVVAFWSLLAAVSGCKDDNVNQTPSLELAQDTLVCTALKAFYNVGVEANGDWEVQKNGAEWCIASKADKALRVEVTENGDMGVRSTDISVQLANLQKKLHIKQLGQAPDILLEKERVDLNYTDTVFTLNVASNVEYQVIIPDTVDWLTSVAEADSRKMVETKCGFRASANEGDIARHTMVLFQSADKSVERSLMIRQEARDKDYNPGDPGDLGDILLPIARGWADQANSKEESIEMSFDGNTDTWYHSPWYNTQLPVTLQYYFENPQSVDYFVYHPRTSGDNGVWGEVEVAVAKSATPDKYETVGTYDLKESTSATKIRFEQPCTDVVSFRFKVHGKGGLVSCAEMEFYKKSDANVELEEIFADELYSELKPSVTQEDIYNMKNEFFRSVAQSLYDKTYDKTYRVQEYDAYREIDDLARELKTSGYCPFENATGIYFSDNEPAIVVVGDTYGEQISLKVFDFDAVRKGEQTSGPASYPLERGINKVNIKKGGLGYIDYFTSNWENANKIKVHIPSGKVNGYFDINKNTSAEFKDILNQAVYGCIDLKGNKINLVYGVEDLKTYCTDGIKLLRNYDTIVDEEHEIMGLKKHNRIPKNHMFARVVNSGLFADGWGAGFAYDTMHELADVEKCIKQGIWCIAHELGHVNQIRPGLKWVSTTEVTNNVYSVCLRYKHYRENLNLEQERVNDGDNNHVLGGRFLSYLNYGVVKGEQWLCQRGQDKMEDYQNGGDHFVKLCPLWQLLLYYREIVGGEKRDWYGDVAEIVRNTDESTLTNGQLQLNFMKNTCDVVKEDLTDFFIKAGMLKPIDKELDDYSRGHMKITQEECDELVRYASRYPKPATPVLYYLTANSEEAFKKRLPVVGTFGKGVDVRGDGKVYISHDEWKNVAVFETYKGDELIKVAMVGTDSPDLSKTLVRYPEGSTRIEAVAWNGKRTLVYGKRE